MSDTETHAAWQKENTVLITMRLQRSTDADIIAALEGAPSRQGKIKELIRAGIASQHQTHNEGSESD